MYLTRHIFFRSLLKPNRQIPSYEERLKILNLEPLYLRRFKFDLLTLFKVLNKFLLIDPSNCPKYTAYRNSRTNDTRIEIPYARLNCRYHSFFVRVPKVYVKLPPSCTRASNPIDFEIQLSKINLEELFRKHALLG